MKMTRTKFCIKHFTFHLIDVLKNGMAGCLIILPYLCSLHYNRKGKQFASASINLHGHHTDMSN